MVKWYKENVRRKQMNKTYVMLKPDCFKRGLVPTLIDEIKANGFIIESVKEVVVSEDKILKHYEEVIARIDSDLFKQSVLHAFVGNTIMALEVSNDTGDCIEKFREFMGATDPAKAEKHTLRGKYGNDSLQQSMSEGRMLNNLIHASDSVENAIIEIELWFN